MLAKKFKYIPQGKRERFSARSISLSWGIIKQKNNQLAHNRFCVIIGTRVEKKSTRRNSWKRAILDEVGQWPNTQSDFLIIPSFNIRRCSIQEIRESLRKTITTPTRV